MKRKSIFALFALLILAGCSQAKPEKTLESRQVDFEKYFAGVEGAFVLYDASADSYIRYNPERCTQQFIPASTFKLLNALIALETGVIADENEIIAWDGVDKGYQSWNQDHNLRTGMQYSVVWFYQELARRIGRERMQNYLDMVGYGNQDSSGEIDSFWLEGGLRISAEEQIGFLRRLYQNDLPFSHKNINTVREIIVLEQTGDYTLSGKTGWASRVERQIGWFVGYLQRDQNVYFFATNLQKERSDLALGQVSEEITRSILQEMGLLSSP